MYSLDQFRKGVRRGLENPAYFGRELNRLYHRRFYQCDFNPDGVAVVDEDWDNLVILDACRYDDFADLHTLPGELQARESRGSHTVEFLQGNFAGRQLLDTVYVTASPQFHFKQIDAQFHAVENVWDSEHWDADAGTVRPETMADCTRSMVERYPNKRLIIHFVQPHYPFIGEESGFGGSLTDSEAIDIWGRLMKGTAEVSPTAIRRAYRQNLETALPSVRETLDALNGRTVVTADHGNMFGERATPFPIREWGHPPGVYTEQLVRVPWLVHEGERRDIRASSAIASETGAESDPTEQLRQLGYLE